MVEPSVGPAVPQRTSARTALSPGSKSKQGRRRRSLPGDRRQTSNHVVVKPASTEVISSLIETLSAISSPAEHQFDSQSSIASLHSTPASPRPWQADLPSTLRPSSCAPQGDSIRPSGLGLGPDFDARRRSHGVHDNYFLHPNRSSIGGSSPRRIASGNSLKESTKEPTDFYDLGGTYSFGNLSIEPNPSIITTNSNRSDGRKSAVSLASLSSGLKASGDSLPESNGLLVQESASEENNTRGRIKIGYTPPGSPGPDKLLVLKRGTRNSVSAEPPNIPTRASFVQSDGSPRRLYRNSEESYGEPSGNRKKYSIPNEDYIPTRNSSMRHSHGLSPSYQKRRSQLFESSSAPSKLVLEDQVEVPEQELQEVPDMVEEDLVNRRIKELKDKKLERDRSSMESPTEFFLAQETPDRDLAPSPSPIPSPPASTYALMTKQTTDGVNVQQSEHLRDTEKSAPAPAIAQRIDRSDRRRISSTEAQSVTVKDLPTISIEDDKRSSSALPQRSNSRLLKRFSRPMTPVSAEKRKTISNNVLESKRNTSPMIDEDDLTNDAVNEYLSSPRLSQKTSDPQTGRVISFSEVGDPEGSVIFCCVGMGLTRFVTAFYDELASTLKLRLVTPDRPGVGGSDAHTDGLDTPLGWPDDVRAICQSLNITKFSILAHSAGVIYALATALRMPQHIRCRVHLLAPWIPPSQMDNIGTQQERSPARSLTYSQRFLRTLPTTFLKAANSTFLSATSASVTTSLPRTPRRSKRKSVIWGSAAAPDIQEFGNGDDRNTSLSPKFRNNEMEDFSKENRPPTRRVPTPSNGRSTAQAEKERRLAYDARLTEAIWDAATTGANPAVDLLVCLERRQPIGFRYVDITRSVVIHHGSKDSRVPVENAKWLGKTMRRCEVRVLEGEGHGLMASAGVMGNVLMEMAQEWSDWRSLTNRSSIRR